MTCISNGILFVSLVDILVGFLAIVGQIIALVLYLFLVSYSVQISWTISISSDLICPGIWSGFIFLIGGTLGILSAKSRNKALQAFTLLMTLVCIAAAVFAALFFYYNIETYVLLPDDYFNGQNVTLPFDQLPYSPDVEQLEKGFKLLESVWIGVQWGLFGLVSFGGAFNGILFIAVSAAMCCCSSKPAAPAQQPSAIAPYEQLRTVVDQVNSAPIILAYGNQAYAPHHQPSYNSIPRFSVRRDDGFVSTEHSSKRW